MYQTFFIIAFKRIYEAIEIYSDHGDGWLGSESHYVSPALDESLCYSSLST